MRSLDALRNGWQDLLFRLRQPTPAGRRWRWGLLLALGGLLAVQGFFFRGLQGIPGEEPKVLRGNPAEEELRATLGQLPEQRAFLELRSRSSQTAQLAETAGRRPFDGAVASVLPTPAIPADPAWVNQPPEPTPEPLPPLVTLKAVMVMGNRTAAVADIEGEGTALILREGTRFGGGQGQVVRISASGLRIRWRGRISDVSLQPY